MRERDSQTTPKYINKQMKDFESEIATSKAIVQEKEHELNTKNTEVGQIFDTTHTTPTHMNKLMQMKRTTEEQQLEIATLKATVQGKESELSLTKSEVNVMNNCIICIFTKVSECVIVQNAATRTRHGDASKQGQN